MNKGLFEELKDRMLDGIEKASIKVAENSTSKCTYLLFYETKIPQELLREEE